MTFSSLCQDLFILAHFGVEGTGSVRGGRWEQRVADYLAGAGVHASTLPGGFQVFGHMSLSGLRHQIDGCLGCSDAIVIAEWKAHRGLIPKNELLRFKAATDDFLTGMTGNMPTRPVMRVFGGPGRTSEGLRMYGALHGITLVDPEQWPAPVLASADLPWPDQNNPGPGVEDRRTLAWLARPFQQVLVPAADGFVVPRAPAPGTINAALQLQTRWSDRLWEAVDHRHGSFESMASRVGREMAAAS